MALASLLNLTPEQRKAALELEHPVYTDRKDKWQTSLDAYEGAGGFGNGGAIWKYRSELPEDYIERKNHARYHNFCESIVDL